METEQHGKDSYKLMNPVMVTSLSDDLAFSSSWYSKNSKLCRRNCYYRRQVHDGKMD